MIVLFISGAKLVDISELTKFLDVIIALDVIDFSTTVRNSILKPGVIVSTFAIKLELWTKKSNNARFQYAIADGCTLLP